ncbi:MAG: peptidoglycan bridge formation glycyltransferase FemA/FemB family protein, partial [Bacilli bacterium]
MKIITLEETAFENFANSHSYRSLYQTSMYANAMKKLKTNVHYIGIVDEDNNLIGASILLYKEVFMGQKYAYAPRGILFDYNNKENVMLLAAKLKKLLNKQGFMYLKIDPYIPIDILNKKGEIINYNKETNIILDNLKKAGFTHSGFNAFFENEKARYEALVLLNEDNDIIYKSFDKQTRNKIQRATNYGVELIKETSDDLDLFYQFVEKKHKRPISYYQALKES